MTQNDPVDPNTTPEIRGKRVRQLRKMSGLSRQAIEDKYDISARTLRSWEDSDGGGLTPKGAMRIVYAMAEEGIHVTKEWLLYGAGIGPQYVNSELSSGSGIKLEPLDLDEESAIRAELLAFRQSNPNPIDMRVTDDGMEPHYIIGDYIGGRQRFNENIASCINRDCIIETAGGELLFRRLKAGSIPERYTLYCINANSNVREPVLYDVELKSVAPVVWHRQRDS